MSILKPYRLTKQTVISCQPHLRSFPELGYLHNSAAPAFCFPFFPVRYRLCNRHMEGSRQFLCRIYIADSAVFGGKSNLISSGAAGKAVKSLSVRINLETWVLVLMEGT